MFAMTGWIGFASIIEETPKLGWEPLYVALILVWIVIAINPASLQRANRYYEVDDE